MLVGVEPLPREEIQRMVELALAEDVGPGDITSESTVPPGATARGLIVAREPLVVSGVELAEETFRRVGPRLELRRAATDGQSVSEGGVLLEVSGGAREILTGERVALNFLQRLSGVATLTRQYLEAVRGLPVRILDTRKTTPGLRRLEKYAVACGGGTNHRVGLFDAVLIKDNHLAVLREAKPNAVGAAVGAARRGCPGRKVEVEVDTLEQLEQALEAGADIVLLDNMTLIQLRMAVQRTRGRAMLEASGGVNLATVRAIAETGVDAISVGALTHSARAVDIALDFSV